MEQVSNQVCSECEMSVEKEAPSLEDVLKISMANFYCLCCSISNYTRFEEEARTWLQNVYHRHQSGVNGMDTFLMSFVLAGPIISSEVVL